MVRLYYSERCGECFNFRKFLREFPRVEKNVTLVCIDQLRRNQLNPAITYVPAIEDEQGNIMMGPNAFHWLDQISRQSFDNADINAGSSVSVLTGGNQNTLTDGLNWNNQQYNPNDYNLNIDPNQFNQDPRLNQNVSSTSYNPDQFSPGTKMSPHQFQQTIQNENQANLSQVEANRPKIVPGAYQPLPVHPQGQYPQGNPQGQYPQGAQNPQPPPLPPQLQPIKINKQNGPDGNVTISAVQRMRDMQEQQIAPPRFQQNPNPNFQQFQRPRESVRPGMYNQGFAQALNQGLNQGLNQRGYTQSRQIYSR